MAWHGTLPDGRRRAAWSQEEALVLTNERTGPDWYTLRLRAPAVAARALPGQFAQVRVQVTAGGADPDPEREGAPDEAHVERGPSAPIDPPLRRPLSFCTVGSATVSFLYRVVGRGTAELACARPGQRLSLLGPLGTSFPDPARHPGRPLLLAGGGLGIPPLAGAARWALAAGRRVTAVLGARSAAWLAGASEVAETGARVLVVTEDGSRGRRGLVTDALAEALEAQAEVWACGPNPMLAAVSGLCARTRTPGWLSVERPMACGFGVCLGCVIATADHRGTFRACVDGPVFPDDAVDVMA